MYGDFEGVSPIIVHEVWVGVIFDDPCDSSCMVRPEIATRKSRDFEGWGWQGLHWWKAYELRNAHSQRSPWIVEQSFLIFFKALLNLYILNPKSHLLHTWLQVAAAAMLAVEEILGPFSPDMAFWSQRSPGLRGRMTRHHFRPEQSKVSDFGAQTEFQFEMLIRVPSYLGTYFSLGSFFKSPGRFFGGIYNSSQSLWLLEQWHWTVPPPWRWMKSWRGWRCQSAKCRVSVDFKFVWDRPPLLLIWSDKYIDANEQRLWRAMIWREEFRIPIWRAFSSWNLQNLDSGPPFQNVSLCVRYTKRRSIEMVSSRALEFSQLDSSQLDLWFADWLGFDDWNIHRSLSKSRVLLWQNTSTEIPRILKRTRKISHHWVRFECKRSEASHLEMVDIDIIEDVDWHWYRLSSDDNIAETFIEQIELILFMHSAWRGSRPSADWAANLITIGTVAHGFTEAQVDDGDGMETGLLVHWYAQRMHRWL